MVSLFPAGNLLAISLKARPEYLSAMLQLDEVLDM